MNRLRERKVARTAELITFQNSEDCTDFIRRTSCKKEKTVLIPGNIGLPRFSPEWYKANTSTSVRRLLYVGTVSISKGIQHVLETLALLRERGFGDIKLIVLGKIDRTNPVFIQIKSLGIQDMITFEGYRLPFSYLAQCDLMVYPTLYDAFPDTVLESLHTGCPVIASRVGGLSDMLKYPELLFECNNVIEITDRIIRCITDLDFYHRIRSLCAERADFYRFDWAEKFEKAMIEQNI